MRRGCYSMTRCALTGVDALHDVQFISYVCRKVQGRGAQHWAAATASRPCSVVALPDRIYSFLNHSSMCLQEVGAQAGC